VWPGRADWADIGRQFLAGPEIAHDRHLLVQPATTRALVEPGRQIVVRPATEAEPQREPAAGHPVERGGLLGEQHCLPDGGEQYLGLYANSCGGAGDERERDQWFRIVVRDPVGDPEGGERARVGASRPRQQRLGVVEGQAKTNFHER
jgi:hypothetical protein